MTLKINKSVFFDEVRKSPFPGKLTRSQVSGMESLLGVWSDLGGSDYRHLAYILATIFHETGQKMQPVREGFAKTDAEARRIVSGREYGKPAGPYENVYYGRGDVQLTWIDNYRRMSDFVGVDLVANPDLALDNDISKKIVIVGMMNGMFTGRSLDEFIGPNREEPAEARQVVNGMDRADRIADYYRDFKEALKAARAAAGKPEPGGITESPVAEKPKVHKDATLAGTVTQVIGGGGLSAVVTFVGDVNNIYALAAFGVVVFGAALAISGRLDLNWRTGE